jgi:hypothetical protein
MDREVRVREIERISAKSGSTRFVLRDEDGNEYTTFRTRIGQDAMRFEGKRARIEFHEEERRGFRNVYLDAIGPVTEPPDVRAGEPGGCADGQHADESAWDTALEAAPWILGSREPEDAVAPEELYERLQDGAVPIAGAGRFVFLTCEYAPRADPSRRSPGDL